MTIRSNASAQGFPNVGYDGLLKNADISPLFISNHGKGGEDGESSKRAADSAKDCLATEIKDQRSLTSHSRNRCCSVLAELPSVQWDDDGRARCAAGDRGDAALLDVAFGHWQHD